MFVRGSSLRWCLVTSALLGAATPARAQTPPPTPSAEDIRAANDYLRDISGRIALTPEPDVPARDGQSARSGAIAMSEGSVNAGYYRIVVERTGDVPRSSQNETQPACRNAFTTGTWRAGQLENILFSRQYDVGLAVLLPRGPQTAVAPTTATPSEGGSLTELHLYRVRQDGGSRCSFDLSYFDQRGTYWGPWIPINSNISAERQIAAVQIRPWAIRTQDRSRIDLFWRGVTGFANLLGPIGTILNDANDRFSMRAQAASFLYPITGSTAVTQPTSPILEHRIMINPVNGTSHRPNRIEHHLQLQGVHRSSTYNVDLRFTVRIEYRGSQFQVEDRPALPEFGRNPLDRSDASRSPFVDLASRPIPDSVIATSGATAGRTWGEITPSVQNLGRQTDLAAINAACGPALQDLERLGFSPEDRALLVFAMIYGRDLGTTKDIVTAVTCLGTPNVRRSLNRLAIRLPEPTRTYDPLTPAGRARVLQAGRDAFEGPGAINDDSMGPKLPAYLHTSLRLAGDAAWLVNASGRPVLPNVVAGSVTEMRRLPFAQALAAARPVDGASCFATPATLDAGAGYNWPRAAGLNVDRRRAAQILELSDGSIGIVIYGILGLRTGQPEVDQIWFGRSSTIGDRDPIRAALRAELAQLPGCRAAAIQQFLSPQPDQQQAAPQPQQANAAPDPRPQQNAPPRGQ